MISLNLGCGNNYLKGWVNCDFDKSIRADKYFNLNNIFPFGKSQVDHILLDNVLEHVSSPVFTLGECHRVLRKGGTMEIIVPYYNSKLMPKDLTHKNFFCEESFDYMNKQLNERVKEKMKFQYGYEFSSVKVEKLWTDRGKLFKRFDRISYYIGNLVAGLKVEMVK